jgi:hypothetical protein
MVGSGGQMVMGVGEWQVICKTNGRDLEFSEIYDGRYQS